MTKLFPALRTAILAAVSITTLASCELYFGESDDGGGGGGGSVGLPCASDNDCAAGCFCALPDGASAESGGGVCEEAGFCSTDEDCQDGYHCDDRSSCVPDTCASDADCETGSVCQNNVCTATCTCTTDTQAQDQLGTGEAHCDEARETCVPGLDPAGYCTGQITCNEKPPKCDVGTVPLIGLDACYTGECRAIAQCEAAPACEAIQHGEDCTARATGAGADCTVVSTGINCTKSDGTACNAGDSGCTCEDFRFNSCETRTAVPDGN